MTSAQITALILGLPSIITAVAALVANVRHANGPAHKARIPPQALAGPAAAGPGVRPPPTPPGP